MSKQYIALLRGINVGGHHRVPMAELREELGNLGYSNVVTVLNSGNAIFEAEPEPAAGMEEQIADHLGKAFGFPIPVIVCTADRIEQLIQSDPFEGIEVTSDIRLYVTFLKEAFGGDLSLPLVSENNSFTILGIDGRMVFSVLDLSGGRTVDGMDLLEKTFDTDMTTRNWNTVMRIAKKLDG